MDYQIRPIEPRDNAAVEGIIRACLLEYGHAHEGTAWADPALGRFSEVYAREGRRYWVAEDENGRLVGGVGVGEMEGVAGLCELQKMYCLPEARGTGLAARLMALALDFASEHYTQIYLETLDNMLPAQRFYEKQGFRRSPPLGQTGHYACDVCYIKELPAGDGKADEETDGSSSALGIPLGLCLGVAYGIIFDNLAIGIALGLSFGSCFGLLLGKKKSAK